MTIYPNTEVRVSELQIGDIVQAFDGPWSTAVVSRIDGGLIHFFRPYGHAHHGCRYAGNQLICYTGLETFTRPVTDCSKIHLWQRSEESDFEIALKLARQLAEATGKR